MDIYMELLFTHTLHQMKAETDSEQWGMLRTYPNIIIALYQLWVSKQASLQYGLNQSKIYNVQK